MGKSEDEWRREEIRVVREKSKVRREWRGVKTGRDRKTEKGKERKKERREWWEKKNIDNTVGDRSVFIARQKRYNQHPATQKYRPRSNQHAIAHQVTNIQRQRNENV